VVAGGAVSESKRALECIAVHSAEDVNTVNEAMTWTDSVLHGLRVM